MKGSLWELAPIVIAAAVAFGLAVGHHKRNAPPPAPAPAAVPAPALSTAAAPGSPAKREDVLPDGRSAPDPSVPPDPSAGPDAAAPADKRR